jgi:hypothetical protein
MAPIASTLAKLLQTVDEQLLHPDENDFVGRECVRAADEHVRQQAADQAYAVMNVRVGNWLPAATSRASRGQ